MHNESLPAPTPWLTEKQLADHLKISTRHLVNLRKAGLPYVQLGAAVRYDLCEVMVYLKTNRRLSAHVERRKRQAEVERRAAFQGRVAAPVIIPLAALAERFNCAPHAAS